MNFVFENYLSTLEYNQRIVCTKFRCRNYKAQVITINQDHKEYGKKFNSNSIGDEFQYIFVCSFLDSIDLNL